MKKVHYNITVKGQVQGVWFRKYTKDKAALLNLTGFVRNKKDGNVYLEAEGSMQQINTFVEWLHKGSPKSKVYEVETELKDLKAYKNFEIKF